MALQAPSERRREFPDAPIVGVGAVALDGDLVLLVRRGREPLKGEWSLPGGVLELGETLEAGVCREVAEETGIEVRVLAMVEVLDKIVFAEDANEDRGERLTGSGNGVVRGGARPDGRVRFHYVLIDFLCVRVGGSLRAGTDAEEARWVTREELDLGGAYGVAAATVAVIGKALALQLRLRLEAAPPGLAG